MEESAVIEQEEYQDNSSTVAIEDSAEQLKWTVSLPDRSNRADIILLIDSLVPVTEKRGVKTLISWLTKYVRNARLADENWEEIVSTTNYVNGIRTPGQQRGDKKRSLRSDAYDFYEGLSTPALRLHCKLFEIDYDAYESMQEIIEVLVQKHVDMVGTV